MKLYKPETMRKHIKNWYLKALKPENGELLLEGLRWYKEANFVVSEHCQKYGFRDYDISQVISILSPQVDWSTNKSNAEILIDAVAHGEDVISLKMFATELQKVNCELSLKGHYRIPDKARKTKSFAMNIFCPSSSKHVTIDRHAVKVAMNNLKGGGVSLTTKQYDIVADCYKKVASQIGILPNQLQAITWLMYKKEVNR